MEGEHPSGVRVLAAGLPSLAPGLPFGERGTLLARGMKQRKKYVTTENLRTPDGNKTKEIYLPTNFWTPVALFIHLTIIFFINLPPCTSLTKFLTEIQRIEREKCKLYLPRMEMKQRKYTLQRIFDSRCVFYRLNDYHFV